MQRYSMTALMAGLLLAASAAVADLNGTQIALKSGDHAAVNVPVEIVVETDEAPAMISVACSETGKKYPATLRDGKLTFIVDEVPANTEATLTIVLSERVDDTPPRVMVTKQADADIVDVLVDGLLFTSYHFGKEWRKPFLWPVNCEGGVGITRDFPMDVGDTPRIARDHPHHKSFWTSYGEVNGHDLWAEGSGAGNQISGEATFGSDDAYGWIRAANIWKDKEGNHTGSGTAL